LSLAEQEQTHAVAWAVYEWIVKSINHDGVFVSPDQPYRDVTSGIWQTIWDGGWSWGTSFYDWVYRPAETLEVGCAICVEHAWLSSALLRALNIPARARVGSAEFWVQKPGEYGYWVGLSTNGGSNAYRQHGILGAGFGGSVTPAFFSAGSEPVLHEDWDLAEPGLWHETHPWEVSYPADAQGLSQAHDDLDGQLGPLLAEKLELPYIGYIAGLSITDGSILAKKEFPGGLVANMSADLPAVLGIQAAESPPRYIAFSRVRQAKNSSKIEEIDSSDLVSEAVLDIRRMFLPERGERAEMLTGSLEEISGRLAELFGEQGAL
jgi:hypothetical protein